MLKKINTDQTKVKWNLRLSSQGAPPSLANQFHWEKNNNRFVSVAAYTLANVLNIHYRASCNVIARGENVL